MKKWNIKESKSSFFLEHLNLNPIKYKCKITKLKCLTQQKEGQTSVGLKKQAM
jgi:hypothetical protein